MLNRDIIYELSKYLDKITLFNLVSTCKDCYKGQGVFFDKYFINSQAIYASFMTYPFVNQITEKQRSIILNKGTTKEKLAFCSKVSKIRINSNRSVNFGSFFPKLTHIKFVYEYNKPLMKLPSSVRLVKFVGKFDRPISNLPKFLRYLELGFNFNQPLTNLPDTLVQLKIRGSKSEAKFMSKIILPPNLKNLEVDYHFYSYLTRSFEKSKYPKISYFPETLESLSLKNYYYELEGLPKVLKYLKLDNYKDSLKYLPEDLENLILVNYQQPMELPSSLISLEIRGKNKYPIDNLSNRLKSFRIVNSDYNHKLPPLPVNLEELEFSKSQYNHPFTFLPTSLKKLIFRYHSTFNHPLPDLPERIIHLFLDYHYQHPLPKIPSGLKRLDVSEAYPYLGDLEGRYVNIYYSLTTLIRNSMSKY